MLVLRDGVTSATGALVRAQQPWADGQLARLYDAFVFDADLPLYLDLARQQGRKVLEVGCGSGRIVVPLVRAGFEVVGIDVSPHMLALAQQKLDALAGDRGGMPTDGAQERHPPTHGAQADRARLKQARGARLVQADMRGFELGEHDFDLAILAVKSFAYLTERSEQLSCLQTIVEHLRPGGMLAIDFLHPRPEWVGAAQGSMRDDLLQHVDEGGFTLSRVESVVSTDLARQVRVIRSAYEAVDDRGAVIEKRFVEWPYRWTYRFEAEHLLERAGLKIETLYGGYQREPFTSSSAAMVFLGRK